jgi:hypothetical protein
MKWLSSALLLLACGAALCGQTLTPVGLQDFENVKTPLTVWVVNIPNENAKVQLSTDHPHTGAQCLKLHYHFVETGGFQYLGIPLKVRVLAPVHKLHFWLYGDNSKCSYGVQIADGKGKTHQYSTSTGQVGLIDFTGWQEVVIDLDSKHETWGGDKTAKIAWPIGGITLIVRQPQDGGKKAGVESDLYFDDLSVDSEKSVAETVGAQIAVVSPTYCSEVKGDTTVTVAAAGFQSVTAKCWQQGPGSGASAPVATVALDDKGRGSFVFPADSFPHGPLTVTIAGAVGNFKDNCYLQLYNKGGVSWNEGLPKDPPPAAAGMKLVFADDFSGLLSIGEDAKATYYDHKPPHGWQDFSTIPFTSFNRPNNPFSQVDTYLRIRASEKAKSAGLLSSLKNDGSGVTATMPCYFECRLVGPNAIGTWPAFWLLTTPDKAKGANQGCDELDIIEAYGGEGPGEPNADDTYMITPHCWNQGADGKAIETKNFRALHNPCHLRKFGIPSTFFETFHTYAVKITETDTIYYCDNIEVGRHETQPLSKQRPFFFLINLATGGGWPVDLSRYGGVVDMYVDYVRVWQG